MEDAVKQSEIETTKVTNVDIEPIYHGWVVTVEYDEDEYRKFAFTNLTAMLEFVKDMTEHPVRVPDGVARVRA